MRVRVDHTNRWLAIHEKGRALYLCSFYFNTMWGEYRVMEISYYVEKYEFLSYRCEN